MCNIILLKPSNLPRRRRVAATWLGDAAWFRANGQRLITTLLFAIAAAALASDVQAEFVYSWGYNGFGALGTTSGDGSTPAPVSVLSGGVTVIAAGNQFSLSVQNGGIYAWGYNFNGNLGDGTTTTRTAPVALTGILSSGVTAIAAGATHSLAVRNGGVYAWGNNDFGQLGDDTTTPQSTPEALGGVVSNHVTAVAAGSGFSLALRDGGVYAWGKNIQGELGNGSTSFNSATPVQVSALTSGVTAISAGAYHSLAVSNGVAYAWGSNQWGELGDGTNIDRNAPIAVSGLASGVTAVAAGEFHSLAVQNGNVYAWGYNDYGALGTGTTMHANVPQLVDPSDLHNIIAVAAGINTSYALSSDGSLWDWGANTGAPLGLGNYLDQHTPQHLLPPSGYRFTSIDVDSNGTFALAMLAPVPEPNCLSLVAIGIACLVAYRCRRTASPRLSFRKHLVQLRIMLPAAAGRVARSSVR